MPGHGDVAGKHEGIDPDRVQMADEFRAAVRVHLQVEVGHDLQLHLGVNLTVRICHQPKTARGRRGM